MEFSSLKLIYIQVQFTEQYCIIRQGNCETAMRLAQERLGVPIVVSPQHMASSDLDQNSGMTYLSYFMKLNSCGYKATLRDVNQLLPSSHVTNFTVSLQC